MKRFWKEARAVELEQGFGVVLDARPLRTPAKAPIVVPTRAMAEAMAAEWDAQGPEVKPATMPVTRAANSTIDRVIAARAAVAASLAAFGGSDLLCYRAPFPPELAAGQAAAWDPLLDWAAARFGARLGVAVGVMHVPQSDAALAALARAVEAHDAWELTALYDLVTISGSLVLGLAVSEGRLTAPEAWRASRIDEDWNIREWGEDEEAAATSRLREADFLAAARLLDLIRG